MNKNKEKLAILRIVRICDCQLRLNNEVLYASKAETTEAWLAECYQYLNISYPKFYKMDILSKLGILAAEVLLKDFPINEVEEYTRCQVLQNVESSLDADRKYAHTLNTVPSPSLFVYTLPNIVMGEIAIKHKFKGDNTFFVSPIFDAAQLASYTKILFNSHIAKVALCGFIDFTSSTQDLLLCLVGNFTENYSIFDEDSLRAAYYA